MELLETRLGCPHDGLGPFPCGPRSQGGHDAGSAAELAALLAIPALSAQAAAAPEARAPPVLRALHLAAEPHAAAYDAARLADKTAAFVQELREGYRSLSSRGKRPWPVLMQAAADERLSAADCDALHALTLVRVAGVDSVGRILIGDHLADAPLDARVLVGDGTERALLDALPGSPPGAPPGAPPLQGEALRRACHDVACSTRVAGAAGLRRMTRDEQVSEVARRAAEVCAARRAAPPRPAGVEQESLCCQGS